MIITLSLFAVILNLLMSSQQTELILEALSKKYEKRAYQEHKILTNTLAPFFPTLSARRVKMLTFFVELRLPPT